MINFPKKILVGKKSKSVIDAEICPIGNSSGEKKKIEYIKDKNIEVAEYDNVPLPGFTLAENRRWDDTYTIIDPRGFLFQISRQNLEKILSVTGITEGLIQQMCIWARDNSGITMSLVPVSSAQYNSYLENTSLLENKIPVKDIKIGDKVRLQNDLVGIYRGCFNLYAPIVRNHLNSKFSPELFPKRHLFEINGTKKWFHYCTSPSIVQMIAETSEKISKEDTASYINGEIANGIIFTAASRQPFGYYYGRSIRYVTLSKNTPRLKLVEVDVKEFEQHAAIDNTIQEYDRYVLENLSGTKYMTESFYGSRVDQVRVSEIVSITDHEIELKKKYTTFGSASSATYIKFDEIFKCYRIIKQIDSNEYF